MRDFEKAKTEFEQNGQKVSYDACSSYSLKRSKEYYEPKGFKYIGSSHVIFINGFRNEHEELYHFFKRTHATQNQ